MQLKTGDGTKDNLPRVLSAILEDQWNDWEESAPMPTCRSCQGKCVKPVMLSCGHVFCWACIVAASAWQKQVCPCCHKEHSDRPEDMEVHINKLRKTYSTWRKTHKGPGGRNQVKSKVKDIAQHPKLLREVTTKELREASQMEHRGEESSPILQAAATKFAPHNHNQVPPQDPLPMALLPAQAAETIQKFKVGTSVVPAVSGRNLFKVDTTHQVPQRLAVDLSKLLPPPKPTLAATTKLHPVAVKQQETKAVANSPLGSIRTLATNGFATGSLDTPMANSCSPGGTGIPMNGSAGNDTIGDGKWAVSLSAHPQRSVPNTQHGAQHPQRSAGATASSPQASPYATHRPSHNESKFQVSDARASKFNVTKGPSQVSRNKAIFLPTSQPFAHSQS